MKSPFPGMDPYLELHWLDVHTKLVAHSADVLNTKLPEDLVASTEERVAVESDEGEAIQIGPDVRVFAVSRDELEAEDSGNVATITAPLRLVSRAPATERFIRVIEAGTERLITVIEFISPSNKRGKGLTAFRRNRKQLLASGVNLVEVDLVRAGNWRAMLRPQFCPPKALTPYRVTVRLAKDRDAAYLHPIPLRSPLPSIAVPLRKQDPQVKLDLQPLIVKAYETGRYHKRIDYRIPPSLPLQGVEAAWADELLRAAGRR